MSRTKRLLASLLVLAAVAGTAAPQHRPISPGVRLAELVARVAVVDGVATTRLRQTWRNDGPAEAEAIWILPLAEGAVADGFELTVGGVPLTGEVLGADQARGIYEEIVRSRRDPGLLEHYGKGCLRARIFPIPARGEAVAEIVFRSVLPERLGVRAWRFLLSPGSATHYPERLVLDLSIRSKKPIRNAFAPSARVQVVQKDEHEVRASFEGPTERLEGKELAVYYGLSDAEFGLDLLSHRSSGASEGTFLMLISPKREWQSQETLKKSIVFVLDTSGSMEGAKIEQAKAALRLFLAALGPEDRFDVVPFATEPQPFFGERVPATAERILEAQRKIDSITAAGGTNMSDALALALRGEVSGGHVTIVVFLTDGAPTVGITDPAAILSGIRSANDQRTRIFVLGVGSTVNTHLLDKVADENGGARDYVREEERIDEKTRALFAKLSHPVMTELVLSIDGLTPTQVVPAKLPDLFAGDRLEVFGRYADGGERAIRLSGVVRGERREYVYEGTFARESSPELAFLAALWAERRVGVLLDAIRLNGLNGADPELVREVERLGREYRIVTPYTSHLVVEPGFRRFASARPGSPGPITGAADDEHLRALGYGGGSSADGFSFGTGTRDDASLEQLAARLGQEGVLPGDAPREELLALAKTVAQELQGSERRWDELGRASTGERAVEESQYLAGLMRGKASGKSLLELFTRRVQDKVFVLRNGIWVDQACGENPAEERRRLEAFSADYFALLSARPALAPYLSLSTRMIVRLGAETFEITAPAG